MPGPAPAWARRRPPRTTPASRARTRRGLQRRSPAVDLPSLHTASTGRHSVPVQPPSPPSPAPMNSRRGSRHHDDEPNVTGGRMTSKPFITCLWFDNQGEEAARHYTSIFKNSRIGGVRRYTDAGPGPEGAVVTVDFELNGQKFLALNGGPEHSFTPAVSLVVECADQAEVDYYWDRLSEGGREIACGWVQDKFGFCWQVVPTVLMEMIADSDTRKAARATAAMLTMTKLDIAELERAYAGAA